MIAATNILFVLSTFYVLWMLYRSSGKSSFVLVTCLGWLALQALLSYLGFYLETDARPPRFVFLPVPPLLLILGLFLTKKGRAIIDNMDQRFLTLVHVVRIPVEFGLLLLFMRGLVPQLMTFEGRNYDIISGLSAPIVYYFYFVKKSLRPKALLVWNIICLGLLLNIVINAILSVPGPLQKFAFDQPNTGVLLFPYSWLPCFIVPVVLFAHLAAIRKYSVLKGNLI